MVRYDLNVFFSSNPNSYDQIRCVNSYSMKFFYAVSQWKLHGFIVQIDGSSPIFLLPSPGLKGFNFLVLFCFAI